jgi:CRISPR-associated protein Cas5t
LSTVLKKLSRYKYGVPSKQASKGNAPDYVEVLCGIKGRIFIDSSEESASLTLEERISKAIDTPEQVDRTGVLCLGLSDDMVDVLRFNPARDESEVQWLTPDGDGSLELPVWVDHVGSAGTRWRRFRLTNANGAWSPSEIQWITIHPPEKL